MITSLPKIKRAEGEGCCLARGYPTRELHLILRTQPDRPTEARSDPDYLQDEDGFPILDEISGHPIFDDLRER